MHFLLHEFSSRFPNIRGGPSHYKRISLRNCWFDKSYIARRGNTAEDFEFRWHEKRDSNRRNEQENSKDSTTQRRSVIVQSIAQIHGISKRDLHPFRTSILFISALPLWPYFDVRDQLGFWLGLALTVAGAHTSGPVMKCEYHMTVFGAN